MVFLILSLVLTTANAATLEEALVSALRKNEIVGEAKEKVIQAERRLSQLKSAPMPNLRLEATHLIQPELSDPLFREFSPEKQTTTHLTLEQPLFSGFREFAAMRQGKNLVQVERHRQLQTLGEVYESVATIFLQVLAFEQDLKNLEDQRRIYALRVKNLLARVRRGESARNEPLSAQSTEAATAAEIELTRSQLHAARERLNLLTGLPVDTQLAGTALDLNQPVNLKSLEHYLTRVSERPDVRAAQESAAAAEEQVSIARGAHWPTAEVIGNYYFERPAGFLEELEWDVQFRVTLPIFEGGLTLAQTREASSRKREADLAFHRVRRAAEAEILSLYQTLHIHNRRLEALKRATELAKTNSEILERDFRRGLARNIDVQAAVAEFGTFRRNYDQARFAARLDLIRLERAAHILPEVIRDAL